MTRERNRHSCALWLDGCSICRHLQRGPQLVGSAAPARFLEEETSALLLPGPKGPDSIRVSRGAGKQRHWRVNGHWRSHINVTNTDGSNANCVSDTELPETIGSWSPDQFGVVFGSRREDLQNGRRRLRMRARSA